MPDNFAPKFVDLVRNYSTTVGTGNFKLSAAVNGYSAFGDVLQAGDGFYYSTIGVDKPAEREVGRGTLMADGTISRDPIGGQLTNFSSGTKSIALIAAAEWFDAAHSLVASVSPLGQSVVSAATAADARAALAIGSVAVLEADADPAFAADSDLRIATQKAVKSYVDGHAGGGGGALEAASRSDLASASTAIGVAYVREKGREGRFLWDAADHSALVSADSAQGISVAPASDPTGVSGAWVRKFDGAAKPDWFGLVRGDAAGANAAANDSAIAAMWSVLAALAPDYSGQQALLDVDLGDGFIEISSPIAPPGTVKIDGRGSGHWTGSDNYAGTVVRAYGCTAFQLDHTRSSLSNVSIVGHFATSLAEAERHGVAFTQMVYLTNVKARQMEGDGFNADGATGLGHLPDSSRLIGCEAWGCRDGTSFGVTGGNGDANVIQVIGGTFNMNRRWAHNDQGFLGNSYLATESATNGVTANNDGVVIGATIVSSNGKLYGAIAGQEAWASVNPPSGDTTDNQGWYYKKAGNPSSGRPAWFNGMLVRAGGAFYTNNVNARHGITDCYAESDQGLAQLSWPTMVRGGTLGAAVWAGSTAVVLSAGGSSGSPNLKSSVQMQTTNSNVTDETFTTALGTNNTTKQALYMAGSVTAPSGFRLKFSGSDVVFDYGNLASAQALVVTGPNTAQQFGTGAAFPYGTYVPALFVGPTSTQSAANARRLLMDTAAPASGTHAVGEFCFNRAATPSGLIGWRNTAQGSPGTWQQVWSGPSEWTPNFTADGDVYIPAPAAMTIDQGNAAIGTGTFTFSKSTSAAPGTFTVTALPATLQAGAWLKVSAAGVSAFCATHLKRTA